MGSAEDDFDCAICQRTVAMHFEAFRRGPNKIIAPICRSCECWYSQRQGKPLYGSFRDRREVKRGFALAEALNAQANSVKWSNRYDLA